MYTAASHLQRVKVLHHDDGLDVGVKLDARAVPCGHGHLDALDALQPSE